MKRFLKTVGLACLILVVLLVGIRYVWMRATLASYPRNTIGKDIHTIVIGASNGECAWDDSILPGTKNLCYSGFTNAAIYNSLRWAIEYNDAPIDTVIFSINIPAILYFEDGIIGKSTWIHKEEQQSLIDYPAFFNTYKVFPDYWKLLTNLDFLWAPERTEPGGEFRYLEREKMDDPHRYDAIQEGLSRIGGSKGLTKEYILDHCRIQVHFLRRIVQYCQEKNLVLSILCTPLYEVQDLVDDRGFYDFMADELPEDSMIADYSHFEMPDSSYFGDLEHLNHLGATYFSEHIAQNGISYQSIPR